MRHRDLRAEMKAEIPFPFYRDSISLVQVRDRVRGRVSEGLGVDFPFFLDSISLVQADRDGGPGEARWKAFYR